MTQSEEPEAPYKRGDVVQYIEEGEELGHTEILSSLLAGEEGDDWPIAYLVWEPLANKERCDELRANARLIAAAPDLLEALREIRNEMSESGNTWEKSGKIALWKANEAIAKAEGR